MVTNCTIYGAETVVGLVNQTVNGLKVRARVGMRPAMLLSRKRLLCASAGHKPAGERVRDAHLGHPHGRPHAAAIVAGRPSPVSSQQKSDRASGSAAIDYPARAWAAFIVARAVSA